MSNFNNDDLTRRGFISLVALASAGAAGAGFLTSCKSEEKPAADKKMADKPADKKADKPAAGGADECSDLSKVSEADKATRKGLGYIDVATDPAKKCVDCNLYKAADFKSAACGGCQVMKGPVLAAGSCTAFVKKA